MTAPHQIDGIDSGLYGDEEDPKTAPAKSVDDQNSENPTHLMAKSAFPGGCKVGDSYQVKLVADHGDEFEISVEPEAGDETSKTETEPTANSELESMNEKY